VKEEKIVHPIPPLYRADSEILILGSFPSVKSRESAFFYGHPQNRFWKVMAEVFGDEVPRDVPERRSFLIRHRVAAWDVIHSCTIRGASDSSITDVVVNDLTPILEKADIRQIFVNGKTAYRYYVKYTQPLTGREAVCLPSTSPANAAWSLERLIEAWRGIRDIQEETR
jgi:hypoxanthine-DNA glycosylase